MLYDTRYSWSTPHIFKKKTHSHFILNISVHANVHLCINICVSIFFSFISPFLIFLRIHCPQSNFPMDSWTVTWQLYNFAKLCSFYKFFYKTFLSVNIVLENEILLAFMCALYLLNILLALMCTMYLLEHVQNLLEYAVELYYTRHTCIMWALYSWQPESTESNYSPVNFRLHSIVFLTMQITNTIYKLQIQITNTNHKYNLQIQITIAICKSVQLSGIERIHEN